MKSLYPDVTSMLSACGVAGPEEPFDAPDAYSGARFSAVRRGGERLILKRVNTADDWPLADLHDPDYREAQFAIAEVELPESVRVATIAASIDGVGRALLMRDVGGGMLVGSDVLAPAVATRVLEAVAEMHARYWSAPNILPFAGYDAGVRLTLLSPAIGQMLIDQQRDFGLLRGWESFARRQPSLWRRLSPLLDDPSPVVAMMERLPATLLHGDLKFGNMSIEDDALTLIDWSMVGVGPVGADMGWFLPVNSSRLPWTLEETLERYKDALFRALARRDIELRPVDWTEQLPVIYATGLMLYGWGKALDADNGRPDELDWWCERGAAAMDRLGL